MVWVADSADEHQPARELLDLPAASDGFDYGRWGNGAQDLAIVFLDDYLGQASETDEQLYDRFILGEALARDVIARLDPHAVWSITAAFLGAWLAREQSGPEA